MLMPPRCQYRDSRHFRWYCMPVYAPPFTPHAAMRCCRLPLTDVAAIIFAIIIDIFASDAMLPAISFAEFHFLRQRRYATLSRWWLLAYDDDYCRFRCHIDIIYWCCHDAAPRWYYFRCVWYATLFRAIFSPADMLSREALQPSPHAAAFWCRAEDVITLCCFSAMTACCRAELADAADDTCHCRLLIWYAAAALRHLLRFDVDWWCRLFRRFSPRVFARRWCFSLYDTLFAPLIALRFADACAAHMRAAFFDAMPWLVTLLMFRSIYALFFAMIIFAAIYLRRYIRDFDIDIDYGFAIFELMFTLFFFHWLCCRCAAFARDTMMLPYASRYMPCAVLRELRALPLLRVPLCFLLLLMLPRCFMLLHYCRRRYHFRWLFSLISMLSDDAIASPLRHTMSRHVDIITYFAFADYAADAYMMLLFAMLMPCHCCFRGARSDIDYIIAPPFTLLRHYVDYADADAAIAFRRHDMFFCAYFLLMPLFIFCQRVSAAKMSFFFIAYYFRHFRYVLSRCYYWCFAALILMLLRHCCYLRFAFGAAAATLRHYLLFTFFMFDYWCLFSLCCLHCFIAATLICAMPYIIFEADADYFPSDTLILIDAAIMLLLTRRLLSHFRHAADAAAAVFISYALSISFRHWYVICCRRCHDAATASCLASWVFAYFRCHCLHTLAADAMLPPRRLRFRCYAITLPAMPPFILRHIALILRLRVAAWYAAAIDICFCRCWCHAIMPPLPPLRHCRLLLSLRRYIHFADVAISADAFIDYYMPMPYAADAFLLPRLIFRLFLDAAMPRAAAIMPWFTLSPLPLHAAAFASYAMFMLATLRCCRHIIFSPLDAAPFLSYAYISIAPFSSAAVDAVDAAACWYYHVSIFFFFLMATRYWCCWLFSRCHCCRCHFFITKIMPPRLPLSLPPLMTLFHAAAIIRPWYCFRHYYTRCAVWCHCWWYFLIIIAAISLLRCYERHDTFSPPFSDVYWYYHYWCLFSPHY